MRIGIVAPEFPPDIGGVETYAYEFSVELARRGHKVLVFTCPHPKGEISGQGFEVLPRLRVHYGADRELLKKYSMDVWHVMNAAFAWMALEASPVVVSVHGNDFLNPYLLPKVPRLPELPCLWRFESRLRSLRAPSWKESVRREMWRGLARATQVIANSEFTRKLLLEHVPNCDTNCSVGYVGVGEDFLGVERQTPGPAKVKSLTTVCRLAEPRKNVDKTLRALAQLKLYEFQFTVVGDGVLRPNLQSLCRELGLNDRVNFTGVISKAEIQRLLASSDLFILTSDVLPNSVEGFGIAYLEANACGVPVLAAKSGGAAEAVCDGKTGYFVDEPTISAIATALERFLKSEIRFKSEDCQVFASRFHWARVVDHALKFYELGQ